MFQTCSAPLAVRATHRNCTPSFLHAARQVDTTSGGAARLRRAGKDGAGSSQIHAVRPLDLLTELFEFSQLSKRFKVVRALAGGDAEGAAGSRVCAGGGCGGTAERWRGRLGLAVRSASVGVAGGEARNTVGLQ